MLGFMFIDPLYLLFAIPGLLLGLWAQYKVKSAVKRWSQVPNSLGMTGAEVARAILRQENIDDVRVEEVPGFLTDHYDSMNKVLRLSPGNYSGRTVAAAGIAAHEVGHAVQHARTYLPLYVRQLLARPAAFGSNLAMYAIMGGFLLQFAAGAGAGLVLVGIVLFSLAVLFTVVTLPVEFNASSRAKALLPAIGFTEPQEAAGVKACLSAAAMTYVAAAVSALMMLLYFVIRYMGMRDE